MDVVRRKRRIRVTPVEYYSRRENDITDVLLVEETVVTEDRFGEHVIVDLRPAAPRKTNRTKTPTSTS